MLTLPEDLHFPESSRADVLSAASQPTVSRFVLMVHIESKMKLSFKLPWMKMAKT